MLVGLLENYIMLTLETIMHIYLGRCSQSHYVHGASWLMANELQAYNNYFRKFKEVAWGSAYTQCTTLAVSTQGCFLVKWVAIGLAHYAQKKLLAHVMV